MIDKETYNTLAAQLERSLNEYSRIEWDVDRYDTRSREAHISNETAESWGTTPAEYFDSIFRHMKIWYTIAFKTESLRGWYYIAYALIEDSLVNHIDIIKQQIAEQIALKLIESNIV